ncbi:hypothetical protein [Streptomyces sp. NPDC056255]
MAEVVDRAEAVDGIKVVDRAAVVDRGEIMDVRGHGALAGRNVGWGA